jgi:glucose/arabinose dehydrogenase
VLAILLLAGCSEEQAPLQPSATTGPQPTLAEPKPQLIPTVHIAPAKGWPEGGKPKAADGLAVSAFAGGLDHPRWLYALPNGDVLVAETNRSEGGKGGIMGWIMGLIMTRAGAGVPSANRITLLRDADGDGVAETRKVFLKDLNAPFGMALIGGDFYVANTDALMRFPYKDGDTEITAAGVKVADLPGLPINHHWTKNIIATPDNTKMMVTVGSNSNIAESGMDHEANRAAILEIDLKTGKARVFASGLRNPNGMAWEPQTGALWTVVNERDELGPDLVPDYLTSVREDGFYGWPWSYYGQNVDERVVPPRPDLVQTAISPDYALTSHVAALGLAFTNDSAMPDAYRNGAFVGNRGSWNRKTYNGYKVIYIPFVGGRPSGMAQDVVTGFLEGEEVRGRPVGLAIDGTGALLIADDAGNTVWRVASADGSVTPEPVPTDRVTAEATQDVVPPQTPAQAPAEPGGEQPAGNAPQPSQTDIAPAVGPEDGAPVPEPAD